MIDLGQSRGKAEPGKGLRGPDLKVDELLGHQRRAHPSGEHVPDAGSRVSQTEAPFGVQPRGTPGIERGPRGDLRLTDAGEVGQRKVIRHPAGFVHLRPEQGFAPPFADARGAREARQCRRDAPPRP